jgi:hypothetical protein
VGFFVLQWEPIPGWIQRRKSDLLLYGLVIAYAGLGYVLHGHRSSIAITILAAGGLLLAGRRDWLPSQGYFFWALAGVHMLFFLVQFSAFYGFHDIIDYQEILGGASRIMRSPEQMRAAGLFQEPNSYCLNLFVIASMAIVSRPSRPLTLVAALTMFLSESLWGIGAAVVLLFLNEMRLQQSPRRFIIAFSAAVAVLGVVFNGYLWLTKTAGDHIPYSYGRILEITKDPSLRERYLRNRCGSNPNTAITALPLETRLVQGAFGGGLTTQYFEKCLAANGIAFLYKSFGLVGLAALLAGFWLALRGLSVGAKLYFALALGFSLTSYPLFTYVIFWIWLPALIGLLHLAAGKPVPATEATAHSSPPAAAG